MEKTLYRTLDYLTHRNMTYSLRSVLGPSEGSVVHVSQPSVTPALLPPDATPADGDDSEDVSLSDGDVQVDIPHGLVVPPVPPDPFPDGFLADVPASADSSTCAVMPSTTPTPPPPPPPISAQHWEESDSVRRVLSEASRVRRGHSTTPRSDPFDDV